MLAHREGARVGLARRLIEQILSGPEDPAGVGGPASPSTEDMLPLNKSAAATNRHCFEDAPLFGFFGFANRMRAYNACVLLQGKSS